MSELVKISTIEELKEVLAKILFSRTDKVTKISDGSVLNGLLFGNAKIGQKAMKDIALVQSHFFPKTAYGAYLDNVAEEMLGLPARFGAGGSTAYIRVQATPGTVYTAGLQTVTGSHGVIFDLLESKTVGASGFAYIRVGSQTSGAETNVAPLTLNTMDNAPAGHAFVTNDYKAINGRDAEDDESFLQRILDSYNMASTNTLAKIEQIFLNVNPNVLRVFNQGTNGNGKDLLSVASQNGSDFTANELQAMIDNARSYLAPPTLKLDGSDTIGIELQNVVWFPVDVSLRAKINSAFLPNSVRLDMQVRMNRYIDYRIWQEGQRVEWDDLLVIAKQTEGVDYVIDSFFIPNTDLVVPYNQLPRIRGFMLYDLEGALLSNGTEDLNPIHFPKESEFDYLHTILADQL